MKKIVLQTMVLPTEVCNKEEIFYRSDKYLKILGNDIIIPKDTVFSTYTYMNCFDVTTWNKYTNINRVFIQMTVAGIGDLFIFAFNNNKKELIAEYKINNKEFIMHEFDFDYPDNTKLIYFELYSNSQIQLKNVCYVSEVKLIQIRPIHISLVICTYKRNQNILENLSKLENSAFFNLHSEFYGGLSIRVVDNGSELPQRDKKNIKIYHNPNTGGSGGFTRGIKESRNDEGKYGITHVILMDDDVEFIEETFYRLYVLLSLIKEDYQQKVIAGRMFRLEEKNIQFTASEIWNKGNVIHVNGNHDMCKSKNLPDMNNGGGEYTGWWFACFTMDFARRNLPLPFFLHCDDVEYGLRHGEQPIVLNGIQVWHPSLENKVTPLTYYYDIRNPLIVNILHGNYKNEKDVWQAWKRRLYGCCYRRDITAISICIIALQDYLKGREYFLNYNKKKEIDVSKLKKIRNAVSLLWPPISFEYKRKGKWAFLSYKRIVESGE